jgi:hypothetical protein
MEKLNTPKTMVRAAEDINRIADALGVRNDAFLLVSLPNSDPNPPYRLEKAESAIRQSENLANDLETNPQGFGLDRITAALTITLLKKATDELRNATNTWERLLGSMSTGKE